MRFGSVCSGIEAASVAWNPLGWDAAWFSEIEPFPSSVLANHYPHTPNLGDMRALPERILSGEAEAPDVLCGGTPCQAFSVAGLRNSLDDERGNLSLTFCEIADAIDDVRRTADLAPTMRAMNSVYGNQNAGGHLAVFNSMAIRRLTTTECERLQGFPDGYTLIQHHGKPAADGPRYKSIGNSWAVPVVRWIGGRIHAAIITANNDNKPAAETKAAG